ncbi:salicylate synthase [Stenomitos frigidus]|uniref:Salicylate synthase n=1 Tax=Stenomitos frigidus ULC18 TaxID=2107698 RepID=A0A2T1DY59_9CYAN|nr:salicylate synthase [Stenomitos frigidus]PSB25415.1 salicylate synthase [Stenomitos frigidus ULC18]
MYQLATDLVAYHELFLPGQKDALLVLQNLLSAQVVSDYVMYQDGDEVRIAGDALAHVTVTSTAVTMNYLGRKQSEPAQDPLKQVEALLAELPVENWTAYGYVSFDVSRFYYPYSKAIEQPIVQFTVPETEIFSTPRGIYIRSLKSPEKIQKAIAADSQLAEYTATPPVVDFADSEQYQHQVATLVGAIQSGELQKAIVSRSIKVKGDMDVLGTYALGARNNNAARSYCLRMGDVCAVGFSPEIFMEVSPDGFVVTNPLAGTRPRDQDPEADARLHNELFTDAKEVKEHALSIWLAQTEIASVCQADTVQVFDFMEVKKYRTVQHLSSRVGGQLKPDKTLWDAMKVLFPGITVSGINKERALAWIDRLEDEPRGLYAGAIGWINSKGETDLAIAIRSAYQYGDCVYLNAGAGIVAESVPENEYVESVNKMNTMLSNLVMKC